MSFVSILLLLTHRSSDGANPEPQEVRVEASEFRFTIDRSTLEAGRPVVLTILNRGKIQHEFASALFSGNDTEIELDGVTVGGKGIEEIELAPGKSVKVKFIPQRRGEIDFICDLPGHRKQGMAGTISIQ